jgi:ABC-type antimicrobial peptide transport system permease subunit
MFYLPYRQQLPRLTQIISFVVRTTGKPSSLRPRIREMLREIDPKLPVLRIETIEDQLDDLLVQERLMADLASLFGATAVLLSCLGLYGVMAYTTARRTKEIGVRLALGATRADVMSSVLGEALVMIVAGIAIGVPASLATTRVLSATLFEVSAADPMAIVFPIALMIAVGAFAGFLPARRACRVDPMVALRCE